MVAVTKNPIQVSRNAFVLEIVPHPPPRNANHVEPYIFVTLFSSKFDTPHLRYITLEWPLSYLYMNGLHTAADVCGIVSTGIALHSQEQLRYKLS